MSEPKQHHFLPRCYLANFCRDDRIWIRDCKKQENRLQKPENVAKIRYYYSFEKNGVRDNSVEKALCEIEGIAVPLIADLAAGKSITSNSKENLSRFLAFLWMRVPDFQQDVENFSKEYIKKHLGLIFRSKEDVKNAVQRHYEQTGILIDVDADNLLEVIEKNDYQIKVKRDSSIATMLKLSEGVTHCFKQSDWIVYHSVGDASFVTTDNPLILVPPDDYHGDIRGCGIATAGTKKLFPLTHSCCLMILDKGGNLQHEHINREQMRRINKRAARQVGRLIISRDEALLENLKNIADMSARSRAGRFIVD